MFLVNRNQAEHTTVTIDTHALGDVTVLQAQTLNDDSDWYAANTLEDRTRVAMRDNTSVVTDGGLLTITLPPVSWTALSLGSAPR